MKKLNDFVKESGWRGLGLWVPAQAAGSIEKGPAMEAYWTERLLWCKEAGVEYWKVDWGTYAHDVEYRLFLTQLASKLYPQLIVEHAYCMIAYNGSQLPTQDYAGDRFARWARSLKNPWKSINSARCSAPMTCSTKWEAPPPWTGRHTFWRAREGC